MFFQAEYIEDSFSDNVNTLPANALTKLEKLHDGRPVSASSVIMMSGGHWPELIARPDAYAQDPYTSGSGSAFPEMQTPASSYYIPKVGSLNKLN